MASSGWLPGPKQRSMGLERPVGSKFGPSDPSAHLHASRCDGPFSGPPYTNMGWCGYDIICRRALVVRGRQTDCSRVNPIALHAPETLLAGGGGAEGLSLRQFCVYARFPISMLESGASCDAKPPGNDESVSILGKQPYWERVANGLRELSASGLECLQCNEDASGSRRGPGILRWDFSCSLPLFCSLSRTCHGGATDYTRT